MKIHAAEALALLTLCSVTTVLALPGVPAKAAVRSSAETETLPFTEAARLLADKYRITLVAEGPAPLRAVVKEANATPENPTSGDPVGLESALQKLAAAYDYQATPSSGSRSVYLFRKRYSHPGPDDLPFVPLEECLAAANDVLQILAVYSPKLNPVQALLGTPLALDLIQTLSPGQREELQKGTLRVGSLTQDQKALAARTALYLYLDIPSSDVKTAAAALKQALGAGKLTRTNQNLVLEGVRATGSPRLWPLVGGLGTRDASTQRTTKTVETPENTPAGEGAGTLGDAILSLQRVSGAPPLSVDAALISKPVVITGAERARPSEMMAAFAEVYGLRVLTTKEGELRLSRRALRLPRSYAEIPQSVRNCLPLPLLSALHDGDSKVQKPPSDTASASEGIVMAAGQRLLSEMEPRFNKPGAKSALPVADLDSASRSALATVLMEPLLKNLTGSLKQQGPDYIAGFDQLYLNGGTYEKDGQTMVRLYLEVRDLATNRLLDSVGIADVKVPPPPQPQ